MTGICFEQESRQFSEIAAYPSLQLLELQNHAIVIQPATE